MAKKIKYPVGQQSFEMLRELGYLYVDKSEYIEKILDGGLYYFLSRPRRFGKSLFLSMLKCFFEGKRHLFKGLYADSMDWNWDSYPVLHLDLNNEKYKSPGTLDEVLENSIEIWEKEYGIERISDNLSLRFQNVIREADRSTGRKVVILVDEYDKPLVNNIHNPEMAEHFRDRLSALYSNFKTCAEHIRLVFLTGVSRFSKLNVFSGLNNINDISLDEDFAGICGITEREILENLQDGISSIREKFGISREQTLADLKRRYDGYHFSPDAMSEDIYNPFSLLLAMSKRNLGNYWIESGQPTLLMEMLRKFNVDLESILHARCTREDLVGLDFDNPRPVALFYQTGYLTIKSCTPRGLITLGIPNMEVEEGFFSFLLPYYTSLNPGDGNITVLLFLKEFEDGDVGAFMRRLQSMFSSISYRMEMDCEKNLHNAMLMLMKLLGLSVRTEMETSEGRIDLFVATERFYYIIELKLNGSARAALDQINDRHYALPFATDGRKIFKIGVNFSTHSRTITDWIVEC